MLLPLTPQALYDRLLAHYGAPDWWPADTPYGVMVGAVLTQNTAWANVEKAIAALGDDLNPAAIAAMDIDTLSERVRPAGFARRKVTYLQAVTGWFGRYGCDVATAAARPLAELRAELLALRGVGPETADSILLYALGLPSFVVDAYTTRLVSRLAMPAGVGYAAVQAYFTAGLPLEAQVYNICHALIVIHGKAHCRKTPRCPGCPLADACPAGREISQ
jgi:endonuclease-3 related protein